MLIELNVKNIVKFILGKNIRLNPKANKSNEKLENFIVSERQFYYKSKTFLIECFSCHASPGVFEVASDAIQTIKPKGGRLLNVGGGTGQIGKYYKEKNFDVINLDISIKETDEKNINFDLNVDDYSVVSGLFDVILIQEVIEHIENPWRLLREMSNKLNNDGIIILTTPNILSGKSLSLANKNKYFYWFTPDCFEYHINPIPWFEVELICNKIGLKIVEIRGSGDYFFGLSKNNNALIENNETLIYILKKV